MTLQAIVLALGIGLACRHEILVRGGVGEGRQQEKAGERGRDQTAWEGVA